MNEEMYDSRSVWDRTWRRHEAKPAWEYVFRKLQSLLDFAGKEILELGSGKGSLSYHALCAGAKRVTLVDFSAEALALARRVFADHPPEKISYVEADLLSVDLGSNFDIVMSLGVVEHFRGEDLVRCVQQHAHHSRDAVAICVPSDTYFNRRRSVDPRNIELYGLQWPIHERDMAELFRKAGLHVEYNRRFRNSFGFPILIRGRAPQRLQGAVLEQLLRPLEPRLGGLLLTIGRVRR
ncbi:MAG TPA: class I SAM-dependent methyltransferase [Anaerolineae bacterium]|nr:class I SAM-dependent methyltransferase [Anaerolineae bacterium]